MKSTLIIVTGPPAAGKTTLATRLADELSLPLVHRDGVKEALFDALGTGDREWSKQLGGASFRLLDYFMELLLRAGQSFIVECNFVPALDDEKFQRWQARYNFRAVQIYCFADRAVLRERFHARSLSSERHPGHGDHENLVELADWTAALDKHAPLHLGGKILHVDTTDFDRVEWEVLFARITGMVKG